MTLGYKSTRDCEQRVKTVINSTPHQTYILIIFGGYNLKDWEE